MKTRDWAVADYYRRMTGAYLRYGGSVHGWHFGLWGQQTSSHEESLLLSNRLVSQDCQLDERSSVLDVGCGVGGLGFFIARTFGSRVLGTTICRQHVILARRLAREQGLQDLVTFRHLAFHRTGPELGSFHLVVNQESLCYVRDKAAYVHAAWDMLRPGGRLRVVDGFLSGEEPFSPGDDSPGEALHMELMRGWKIPPLEPIARLRGLLDAQGFTGISSRDISSMAEPSARAFTENLDAFNALSPVPQGLPAGFREHVKAAAAFGEGLLKGVFCYAFLEAIKPA